MFQIHIPHADAGHNTIVVNDTPEDRANAALQINDLIRQGFAVFAEKEGQTVRIDAYDASMNTFKIGDKAMPADGAKATAAARPSGGCIAE